jgi:hypothetical protein
VNELFQVIEKNHVRWIPAALIVAGAALRIHAYAQNASLSIDEAAIARNLAARSFTRIFGPLDFAQIAPPGFLALEKLAMTLFGRSEYALRAVPLALGLMSLWLCWDFARRAVSFWSAVYCLAFVALNPALVAYSVISKQYSGEVAAALLIVWLAARLLGPGSAREAPWLALTGAAAVLFSFTAVFVLAGASVTLAAHSAFARAHPGSRRLGAIAGFWAVAAVAGAWLARLNLTASDSAYMHWFWAAGFMPFPPRTTAEATWLWSRMKSLFGQTAHYRATSVWVLLAAAGAYSLARRTWTTASIVLTPAALVVIASAARLYPFASGRVQLFLLPLLLLVAAEGVGWAWSVACRRVRVVAVLPAAVLMFTAAYATLTEAGSDPREELRPFLEQVTADWRPGDMLYVYYGLGQAFLYYAPRYHIAERDYVVGTCSRGSGRTYLRELDRLRGRPRVWIALPHREDIEVDLFVRYLDTIGRRLQVANASQAVARPGVVGYLYDLTRSERSGSVSADSFALPERLSDPAPYPWSCYGVFQPVAGATAGAE